MIRKEWMYILLLLLCACSGKVDIELPMLECTPIPSPRAASTCFVYQGKAYIYGGRDSTGQYLSDMWCYDPIADQWKDLGETPLKPRVNATACVENGIVYIGLGFNGRYGNETAYFNDWWRYNPATGDWQKLASYPNHHTDRAVSFANGNQLYVGYGFQWTYTRDMFSYHIPTNRWDSIDVNVAFLGYPARSFGGCGAVCGGRYFYGSGYRGESLDWWAEFIPSSEGENCTAGEWQRRKAVPGNGRTLSAAAATDNYVYLTCGFRYGGIGTDGHTYNDIQRYDPQTNKWACAGMLPGGLMNHIAFSIDNAVYVGIGENDEEQLVPSLYKIIEQ